MLEALYSAPFSVLRAPNVKVRLPSVERPGAMTVFAVIFLSYWLVTAGIIYDIITETPSFGQTLDERGNVRPQPFLPYRINGQFIIEGITAAFMFALGAIGFIMFDRVNNKPMQKLERSIFLGVGSLCVFLSFVLCRVFIRMKLPGYLSD
ncbi:hypothetical protein CAOG_07944 [Capsaspora owczarzaki ATCC 30864]|uniref:Oligosaccharyltransferase complex subunit n=1 Tax=Capsaspora owczarzaki (strain ATCC 30864) TaxID=595528 RepID=A0A0D2WXF5_CAPO3|nr:hypothetical protein CAOG_07944 [Capsaspora owczarzaki ATCC 30864]KJE97865.1 hypothetical protein CAOG_007944 [Capsaspora owczarzaki ATCC 30864]|eukprot:XP_004343032.1 hypothetical protein CAOG_07944 [Capsaspora owczarzaki ATCC 30864]